MNGMNTQFKNKPPVVLIHGMWSTAVAMQDVAAVFTQQGFEVHALTLPMHFDKSSYTTADKQTLAKLRLQDYVAFIMAEIAKLDRPAIIVGHSMGGLLAQLVAARTHVAKLILLSSAAPGGINAWSWSVIRTFGRNLFLFPLWRRVTHITLAQIRYGIANTQPEPVQQLIYQHATYESGRATFQMGVSGFFPTGYSRVNSASIRCPILIIAGNKDRITPIKAQRAMAKKYARNKAQFIELEGVCHWTVGGEHVEVVRSAMLSWLAEDAQA